MPAERPALPDAARRRIVVFHRHYGCDTGCCGHAIGLSDDEPYPDTIEGTFSFDHPDSRDDIKWAKEFVREQLGADHVADLDWENCLLVVD